VIGPTLRVQHSGTINRLQAISPVDHDVVWATPDRGIAMSDAVNGRFPVIRTTDGGADWNRIARKLPPAQAPDALSDNVAISSDGGKSWELVSGTPFPARPTGSATFTGTGTARGSAGS